MKATTRTNPAGRFDSAISDPPVLDPAFPPEELPAHFMSHGTAVQADAWIAQGAEPRGTVILCPQLFGGDRLESLIIPMLSAGMNVVTYHPRGMWDSDNDFTLQGALEDAVACVDFVRSTADGTIKTLNGATWRTDPSRIVVMGLSGGGGNVSLRVCADDPNITSAIAIAPNSLQLTSLKDREKSQDLYETLKTLTAGRIDQDVLYRGMTPEDFHRLSPVHLAPSLVDKNILLIGAELDVVSPVATSHEPIARALRDAGAKSFHEVILASDHMFLTKRIALAQVIIGWLQQECDF